MAAVNLASMNEAQTLGLSRDRLMESKKLRGDYLQQLASLGFFAAAQQEGRWHLLRAACTAAFYPQVVKIKKPETRYVKSLYGAVEEKCTPKEVKYYCKTGRVFCSPGSVLFSLVPMGHFACYSGMRVIKQENEGTWSGEKWLMEGTSDVAAHALLFFGGPLRQREDILIVGETFTFQGGSRLSVALVEAVRRELSALLLRKINQDVDIDKEPVVCAVRKCLVSSGMG